MFKRLTLQVTVEIDNINLDNIPELQRELEEAIVRCDHASFTNADEIGATVRLIGLEEF